MLCCIALGSLNISRTCKCTSAPYVFLFSKPLRLIVLFSDGTGVTHVMIVACYHPLPLSACMLHFDLVSILFGTSIPTSFNILVKTFLHFIYICFTGFYCV